MTIKQFINAQDLPSGVILSQLMEAINTLERKTDPNRITACVLSELKAELVRRGFKTHD
jgi:hypothetical protein